MRILIQTLFLISSLGFLNACSQDSSSSGSSQQSFSYIEEPVFCSNPSSVSNPVVISARAQFLARNVTSAGLQGALPTQDIKFAEVEVLNASGARVQCGTTDASGNISVQIEKIPGDYTLRVNSRADNDQVKASVLNSPFENKLYSIQIAFSVSAASTSLSLALPLAPLDGSLEGGAFNILDQIYKANHFIRSNSTCPTRGNICPSFSVAPKIQVFWTQGLSPYSYFGYPESPISFFTATGDGVTGIRRGLYIQGGLRGDVNCSDTDHFDNSVILHEYGHFLEDSFAKSDSPGGSHNGNFIIDPRLAWSEGWANFFQTAVLANSVYRDTVGNSSCTGGTYLAVNLNLETAQNGQDRMLAGTQVGEGHFREVSVARTLYDIMDSGGSDGGAGVGFSYIWKVFSDADQGLRNPQNHFRNIGLFSNYMKNLISTYDGTKSSAFDSALSNEYQLANENEYGLKLSPGSQSCSFQIQGAADIYSMGTYYSNLLKSNDFFRFNYDGSRPIVELHYSGSGPSDLDLDVYQEDYVYDDSSTIVRRSHSLYPEQAGTGFETVNFSGLPYGTYLINVRVNSDRRAGLATYFLSASNGERFCP